MGKVLDAQSCRFCIRSFESEDSRRYNEPECQTWCVRVCYIKRIRTTVQGLHRRIRIYSQAPSDVRKSRRPPGPAFRRCTEGRLHHLASLQVHEDKTESGCMGGIFSRYLQLRLERSAEPAQTQSQHCSKLFLPLHVIDEHSGGTLSTSHCPCCSK